MMMSKLMLNCKFTTPAQVTHWQQTACQTKFPLLVAEVVSLLDLQALTLACLVDI
jgi:hypothetical protein